MKSSTIFKRAGQLIARKEELFICFAINRVDPNTRLYLLVMNRLKGCESYGCWLRRYHPTLAKQADKDGNFHYKARAARVAWCNALAAEFKAKGD
mgnify:CR=1 FL=1